MDDEMIDRLLYRSAEVAPIRKPASGQTSAPKHIYSGHPLCVANQKKVSTRRGTNLAQAKVDDALGQDFPSTT